ncbi:MAG: hypothetical protein JWM27_4181 [Gemmatimonadetes bacterium]|nr:hypothetical protein [Gemmatimonadota bacterium]
MTTAAPAAAADAEVEVFRSQARMTQQVVRMNTAGLTHEESLIQPDPAGNCLNWVVGHVLWVYNQVLGLLQQERVMPEAALKRYERGSPPIHRADEALDLDEMMATWDETARRVDAGLAGLTREVLDRPAPMSPSGNPDETVRSLVATVMFHQAYHAGQTGLLRRLAGKEGAIP